MRKCEELLQTVLHLSSPSIYLQETRTHCHWGGDLTGPTSAIPSLSVVANNLPRMGEKEDGPSLLPSVTSRFLYEKDYLQEHFQANLLS